MPPRKEQSDNAAKASVNMEELRELIALLRDNGLAELELEREDFRVRLRREGPSFSSDSAGDNFTLTEMVKNAVAGGALSFGANDGPAPAASTPAHPGAEASTAASSDQDLHIVPSPIVGTFYRSPSPTAEPFVKIGSNVEPATVVCIIEAMKLMNEIQAETSGEVAKIYVENGQPVEYGQPLFGIRS
jgi:acetyl-CoA carboxylase biotin carboxyl carrier protein